MAIPTDLTTTPTGLQYKDLTPGAGKTAEAKRRVRVHYTGTFVDGEAFDSSRDRGEPLEFTLGVGQVIRGWDEGVVGMQEGGRRILVIPGHLAYGSHGVPGAIPPNATLVFDVELVAVK